MPIKIPEGLPAAGILENENIFRNERTQGKSTGHKTAENSDSESDAHKNRDGNAAYKTAFKYAVTDRADAFANGVSRIQKHAG